MKTIQHATKNPMSQWSNQRGNHNILWDQWKWKHTFTKSMGCRKSSSKMEVQSGIGFHQGTRKISNKQLNLLPKIIRKKRTKPKVSRRKEIIKISESNHFQDFY